MNDPIKPEIDDVSLDALFADARADAGPGDELMDRIIADAAEVARPIEVIHSQPGIFAKMLDALGGWPSVSGLATAAVAGIYIGFTDPTLLQTVGLSIESEESADLLLGDDVFFDDATAGEL